MDVLVYVRSLYVSHNYFPSGPRHPGLRYVSNYVRGCTTYASDCLWLWVLALVHCIICDRLGCKGVTNNAHSGLVSSAAGNLIYISPHATRTFFLQFSSSVVVGAHLSEV